MRTADQRSSGGAGRFPARLFSLFLAITLLGLSGCGSGDSSGEPDKLDIGGSTSSGAEEQLEQLVADYESALTRLKKTKAGDGSFDGVLTPELAETYLANYRKNVFGSGKTIAGRWRIQVQDVEVDGDMASIDICSDGRQVYVVDASKPKIGEDSMSFTQSPRTLKATRSGDDWLISEEKERKGSCS